MRAPWELIWRRNDERLSGRAEEEEGRKKEGRKRADEETHGLASRHAVVAIGVDEGGRRGRGGVGEGDAIAGAGETEACGEGEGGREGAEEGGRGRRMESLESLEKGTRRRERYQSSRRPG